MYDWHISAHQPKLVRSTGHASLAASVYLNNFHVVDIEAPMHIHLVSLLNISLVVTNGIN